MPIDGPLVCALVIGHKFSSPGAVNEQSGLSEFEFNDALARDIELRQSDVIIQRIYRRTYDSLPSDINQFSPDFAIGLHCNAYNKRTKGCEVLYHHSSSTGRKMAEVLSSKLSEALGNRNRGAKPRAAEDQGGYLLRYVNSPCLIAEPFFIDNNDELTNAKSRRRFLVNAYLDAINEIAHLLRPEPIPTPVSLLVSETILPEPQAQEAGAELTESEGWTNVVAHQSSIDYWAATCPEGYAGVLMDPLVKDMSFFNPEVTSDVRRNEMRSVVGLFLRFHRAFGNPEQPGGISEDEAFSLLVEQFTAGECRLSISGDVADGLYVFTNEQEA